jgi:hypothetical protein
MSENWESVNPILQQGEPGVALDLYRMKIGDGFTPWNDLPWFDVGKSAYDLACEAGFEGSLEEWLDSLAGHTPTIGPNGNWIINDVDTGIPATPDLTSYATKAYVEEFMIALTKEEILDICNKK